MEKKSTYEKYFVESEFPARDRVYNWIVRLYERRGKPWTTAGLFNDDFFFHSLIYSFWPWIPSIAFLYITYWAANWMYDKYGLFRAVAFIAVMILLRVNTLIRKIDYVGRKVNAMEKRGRK